MIVVGFDLKSMEPFRRESLLNVINIIQSENDGEIKITAIGCSCENFLVKAGNFLFFVNWDSAKTSFSAISKPELSNFRLEKL